MQLLVDIGNTRIKWVECRDKQLSPIQALVYQNIPIKELITDWHRLDRPTRVVIACVGSGKFKHDLHHAIQCLWPEIYIFYVITPSAKHGVHNGYLHAEKLGVDRWLAITGAYANYQGALCIVDCGTAITLDAIDAEGQHWGGMIMAGWSMMQLSLQQGTAALAKKESKSIFALADNTQSGIDSGGLAAIQGFIQSGLSFMQEPCQLILTGGDALFLQQSLGLDAVIDVDLVFKGLLLEVECA